MRLTVLSLLTFILLSAVPVFLAEAGTLTTGWIGVVRDEEFGNVYIALTIDEFNALGFDFGDSLNVTFDNGRFCEDLPYYSGYYTSAGELLACGYPGYPHVVIARNYGASTWEEFDMTQASQVTVTLNEKGKYLATQELFALVYSNLREDYDSDREFANFREVRGGTLREHGFYRSASPCDNQYNRAGCANALAEEYGIRFVLNLSDSEARYVSYTEAEDFESSYYDGLYREGSVLFLALNANYRSDGFAAAISNAFAEMTDHEGPCLIHCVEGKDRTGFVCALLLALAGASPDEIVNNYMLSYENYYHVTKEGNPDKYEAILEKTYDFLYCLCGAEKGTVLETLDLKAGAESYLRRGGLSDAQIARIEDYIR